jgi:hypothetical protein
VGRGRGGWRSLRRRLPRADGCQRVGHRREDGSGGVADMILASFNGLIRGVEEDGADEMCTILFRGHD